MLLNGLSRTLLIAFSAALIGILLSALLALMRLSNGGLAKVVPLRKLSSFYIDPIRGTPVVVH